MLRTNLAPLFPRAILSRANRWTAMAALFLCLPSMAAAASVTFDLLDPTGYGSTVTLEDGEVPGTLTISIDSISPLAAGGVGDILGIYLTGEPELIGGLDASGADVAEVSSLTGSTPNRLVNIGAGSVFQLNGITSTSFLYTHPSEDVSLEALVGANLSVWIGFDTTSQRRGVPGIPVFEDLNVIKPEVKIPAIPEPGTAALMMMGLIGLAMSARHLGEEPNN